MIVVNARFLTKKITGLERYASELSSSLKKNHPQIKFVTHRGVLNRKLAEELDADIFGILRGHLWEQIELPLFLKKYNSPVLLNPVNTGPIYYKNQTTIIHDLAFLRHPEWYSKKAAKIFKFIVTRVVEKSEHIFTVSEFSKSEIIDLLNFPEEIITVIKGAVPEKLKKLTAKNYNNKFGKYILTVSTLEPRKNLLNLIKAFLQLRKDDLKLVIVGEENKRVFSSSELPEIKRNDIIFTGYVSDEELVGLYKNAKLFVYPSFYEGFGLPPLEAHYCNTKLLLSDINAFKEIFKNDVAYCKPNSVEDITKKINDALKRKSGEINESQIKSVNLPRWDDISEKLVNVLDEL